MRSLLRTIAIVAVLLPTAVIAACGPKGTEGQAQGDDGSVEVTALDPCALISADELAAVVATVDGGPPPTMTVSGPTGTFQGRRCTWSYPRPEVVTDTAEISVTTWRGTEYYTPDALPGNFTAVSGIGDAAHVGSGMFMFRAGADVFSVEVFGDSNLDALRPAIATAIDAKL